MDILKEMNWPVHAVILGFLVLAILKMRKVWSNPDDVRFWRGVSIALAVFLVPALLFNGYMVS